MHNLPSVLRKQCLMSYTVTIPMCIWGGLDGLQEHSTQVIPYQKHLHIQMECGQTKGLWQIALQESSSSYTKGETIDV